MALTQTYFQLLKDNIPDLLIRSSLEHAVTTNFDEMDLPNTDKVKFTDQTLRRIINAIYFDKNADFWIAVNKDGSCGAYLLAKFIIDSEGEWTYWISQAYVSKEHRNRISPFRKNIWELVRQHAKDSLCKHIIAVSGRENSKAYCRLLGDGWYKYATLLKEDL